MNEPLVDSFGRIHTSLRISVTDRCNIRCFYCMPEEVVQFKPRSELLTFEEMERFVSLMSAYGIHKIRLTGGEPLVRANLPELVSRLANIPGITDLALTTNGILLSEQAVALKQAGLHRLNISLDTLNEATFFRISRRSGLQAVLNGIAAAKAAGFTNIRLNTVAIRGITEPEIIPLAEFARNEQMELRFIEYMPLDADANWQHNQVLTGEEIRQAITHAIGELIPAPRPDASQPAIDFSYANGGGTLGFINPVSHPFCGDCNRLRITAEGKLRNCLFSTTEWDIRELLRQSATDHEILTRVRACLAAKKPGHGIDSPDFLRPERAMYEIGG